MKRTSLRSPIVLLLVFVSLAVAIPQFAPAQASTDINQVSTTTTVTSTTVFTAYTLTQTQNVIVENTQGLASLTNMLSILVGLVIFVMVVALILKRRGGGL